MTAPPIQQAPPEQGQPGQPPVQTALMPPKMPWTPFEPMPTDDEPAIAAMRRRKLARLIDSAKFESHPPEWKGVAIAEYQRMRQVESQAAQAAAQALVKPAPPGKQEQPKPGAQPNG